MRWLSRLLTCFTIVMFGCLLVTSVLVLIPADTVGPAIAETSAEALTGEAAAANLGETLDALERLPWARELTALVLVPIVLIAGFSEGIGHAVVLFANQVHPGRFAITLWVRTLVFVGGYFVWVFSITLIAFTIFGRETGVIRVLIAVALAYVPLIFSFLVALPYFGNAISSLLYLWAGIVLIQSLALVFDEWTIPEAALCALAGLLLVLILRRTVGQRIGRIVERVFSFVSGTTFQRRLEEALRNVENQLEAQFGQAERGDK